MKFTFPPSGPVPPESNPPIEPQFYQPSRFDISNISLGFTTLVTTSIDHNYVIGQLVRLLVPVPFGSSQLNEVEGYVISIPSSTQVSLDINSIQNVNAFVPNPFTATISGATKANPAVLTVSNPVYTNNILITGVSGMTELNGHIFTIIGQTASTITINVDSTSYTTYLGGGNITVFPLNGAVPQIVAVGDINTGQINSSGRTNNKTYIPGSFINISPL